MGYSGYKSTTQRLNVEENLEKTTNMPYNVINDKFYQ